MDLRKFGGRVPKSPVYRFNNSFVKDENTGCWNWLGKARSGKCKLYGRIKVNKISMPAHRFSWELHNGKQVPEGMIVMHKCDNPECVNPDHLLIGTTQDNSDDKVSKNRQAKGLAFCNRKPAKGSKNGLSKLTEDQAKEIFNDKNSQRQIAQRYGVSQTVVHNIKSMKTWKIIHD